MVPFPRKAPSQRTSQSHVTVTSKIEMLTSVGGSPRRLRFLTCQTSRRNVTIAPPCQLHGALAKTTTSPSKRPNHAPN
ncbi:MAG: hypothetical protein ACTS42_01715 [Candidatus Hodgkinia cicadicola]